MVGASGDKAIPYEDSPIDFISRIDWYSREFPDKIFACTPKDGHDISAGFNDVTWRQFGDAVDRASWWLETNVKNVDPEVTTFAYAGPYDLRWCMLLSAAIKTGLLMQLNYTTNAIASLRNLYSKTGCNTLLHAADKVSLVDANDITSNIPIKHDLTVPELNDWLDLTPKSKQAPYPYNKTWEETYEDVVCYFQSSGTTGLPKPVPFTNRMFSVWWFRMARHGEPPITADDASRSHSPFHISHISGMLFALACSLYTNLMPIIGPVDNYNTVQTAKDMLKYGNIEIGIYPPSLLSSMCHDPECLELIRSLRQVRTGGAMLDDTTAQTVMDLNGPLLINGYGSSETQGFTQKQLPQEHYPYFHFEDVNGIRWDKHSNDLYELVVVRDEKLKHFQPIFSLFSDLQEFRTKDLFSKHPTNPNLWRIRGRVDDTVVLNNAHNIYVADMERRIEHCPEVSAAVVFGQGLHLVLLLELEEHIRDKVMVQEDHDAILDKLWPAIEDANGLSYSKPYCHITRDTALIVPAETPLPRLSKRSVDKRNARIQFEPMILAGAEKADGVAAK